MSIYKRLRDLREDADKSQEEIAKIIGTSQSYYAQYEAGKRSIPFERIVVLAVAGKNDVEDALRRFCIELTKERTANVALMVDGTEVYANNVKEILKGAGTNVIEDVLYIKCGLPLFSAVKPEEEAAVIDWLDNKVINNLK